MKNSQNIKIEVVSDYNDRSSKTLQFCKDNLDLARSNQYLKQKARSKIREKLLEGIEITEKETGITMIKKFDYPVEYISQVMNPHNRTYNKWVIICALNYKEEYADGEDPTLLAVKLTEAQPRKKSIPQKSLKKGAIAKRTGLVKK